LARVVEQDVGHLTLGGVMRDGPQSLMYITEGSGTILHRAAASASAISEEAAWRFLSPGVDTTSQISSPTFIVQRAARHHFWVHLPAQDDAARSQRSIKTISGQS